MSSAEDNLAADEFELVGSETIHTANLSEFLKIFIDSSGNFIVNVQESNKGITGQDNTWSIGIDPNGQFVWATVKKEYPNVLVYDVEIGLKDEDMEIEFKNHSLNNPTVQAIYDLAVEFLDNSGDPRWMPHTKAKIALDEKIRLIDEKTKHLDEELAQLRAENTKLKKQIADGEKIIKDQMLKSLQHQEKISSTKKQSSGS